MIREVLPVERTCGLGVDHLGEVDEELRCTVCRRSVFESVALGPDTTIGELSDLLVRNGARGLSLTFVDGSYVAGVRGASLSHMTASAADPATAIVKALQAFVEGRR